jgi:hypothetical protein
MRQRITPSLVLAVLAVVLAAAGGAAAQSAITGRQIENASITGADIRNRSLTARDIRRRTLRALRGAQGPAGAPGAPGAAGPAGTLAATVEAVGPAVTMGSLGSGTNVQASTAECPAGTVVTGGGWDGGVRVFISQAKRSGNGYFVIGVNTASESVGIQAQAFCGAAPAAPARAVATTATDRTERARLLAEARRKAAALE